MPRPERKKLKLEDDELKDGVVIGYNQACSDWERWIDDADIQGIIYNRFHHAPSSSKFIADEIRRLLRGEK